MSTKLDQVKNVDVDSQGRFKYILVKVKDGSHQKYIVRGYGRAGYHGTYFPVAFFKENSYFADLFFYTYDLSTHQLDMLIIDAFHMFTTGQIVKESHFV